MRGKKSNRAPSFTIMHVALLLLCAVLLSSHATIGLYASYKTTASGSSSAQVAKFDVNCVYDPETGILKITNNSEVTVEYIISASIGETAITASDLSFDDKNDNNQLAPGEIAEGAFKVEGDYSGEVSVKVSVSQVD